MKSLLLSLLLPVVTLAGALDRPAGTETPIPSDKVGSMKSYSIKELAARSAAIEGAIVKVKFEWCEHPMPGKDGATTVTIGDKTGFTDIRANVPAEGSEWLARIGKRTDATQRTVYAIARVEKGSPLYGPLITILGREIRTDMKGSVVVW